MVITNIQKSLATAGLGLTFVLGLVGGIYHVGAEAGRAEIQQRFDAYQLAEAQQWAAVTKANAGRELLHRQEIGRIEDQLHKTEAAHEATIATTHADLIGRLHASESRAAVFRRMSEAGSAQCSDLADHTAQLDRALVEGRSLVEELRSTIEFREGQLRSLGAVITNDRQLVGEQ